MSRSTVWLTRSAVLALLPLAACARTEATADNAANQAQAAAQAQTNPTLSTTDTYFLEQAARGGIAEVQEGQLAAKQARRADVRRFAQQMVTDHTWVNQALEKIARAKQITPPTEPGTEQLQSMQQLASLRGSAFDRQYLNAQVADHETTIKLFQNEAQNGTDPDVKAFAERVLPRLQEHLSMAERLGGHGMASS